MKTVALKMTDQQLQHSHAKRWILAHDITDPSRLNKVWRFLRKEGVRLQYSVYVLSGDRDKIQKIIDGLQNIIHPLRDDVRIYPITENTRIWGLGTQFADDGNQLCDQWLDKHIVTDGAHLAGLEARGQGSAFEEMK